MTWHYEDININWLSSGNGKIGYDIPLILAGEYTQLVTLATVALNIGYHIGQIEARRAKRNDKPSG